MVRLGRQDHQVGDVDHADLQRRRKGAQELGGFDHFEGDLDADADEDDVWVVVGFVGGGGGCEGPDGGALAAVGFGFGRGEVDCCGLFGADDEVGFVAGLEAVVEGG